MNPLQTLFQWYGKRTVIIAFGVIALLVVGGIVLKTAAPSTTEDVAAQLPTVRTAVANSLSDQVSTELIGTVRARNEAEVETESAGRVTAVRAELGDTVTAGQILVQLENASEAAAVLQAEGSYDAAVAAAAQSDVSVSQAENAVITAENAITDAQNDIVNLYRDSYTTANNILLNQIDQFYTDPYGQFPRVKIDDRTNGDTLTNQRIAFRTLMPNWQSDSSAATVTTDSDQILSIITTNTRSILAIVDIFIEIIPRESDNPFFSDSELEAELASFISASSQLNNILASVEATRTQLTNAEKSLENAEKSLAQAQIGGTNSDVSAANAQVKQALGSLRSAQAAFAKTIVRSPIAGQVNKINVNPGDFLGSFTPVATIANNNALEITTFVGEADRALITLEQAVRIEGSFSGTITNIAPAVDPVTKKVEVKIATENETIQNGDTVTISITGNNAPAAVARFMIPLTAVKFTETDGVVYTVEDNTLIAFPVTLGDISGSYVEILDGIERSAEIVIDARGRAAGQKVEALTN